MDKTNIAIIGGGPSGIMAAIIASENGAKVCIYEKMEKLGKKLLVSGRGRCNFTNKKIGIEHYHSTSSNFVSKSISQFGLNKTLIFFKKIGITYKSEKNGKIFPLSEQSSSILELLNAELKEKKVDIAVNTRITNIEKKGNGINSLKYSFRGIK